MVSPVLARYTRTAISRDLWNRPYLSRCDRSIVTLAALIARNQTLEMPYYLNLALHKTLSQPTTVRKENNLDRIERPVYNRYTGITGKNHTRNHSLRKGRRDCRPLFDFVSRNNCYAFSSFAPQSCAFAGGT